jgi:nitronate monooxygenase
MWKNTLTKKLRVTYPIIKAPMFGTDSPELIASVSNSGGLGTYGIGRSSGEVIRSVIKQIRELTDQPFAINLFIPEKSVGGFEKVDEINKVMDLYRKELGINPASFTPPTHILEEQLQVLIEEKVPVVSFTFGYLETKWIDFLKQNGTIVCGTATNVREAVFLEQCGVDFIVGQGSEAGGHRGTFVGEFNDSMIGTMALIPQIINAVNIPVVAAGGIMDGRGVVAAFALGASGVQMGTAFLTCEESGAPGAHKEAILHSTEEQSMITTTFSGKPARGINNFFKKEMEQVVEMIPGYPIQDVLTKDIRDAAAQQNKPEFMSLWAGQATRLSRSLTAKELLGRVVIEAEKTLEQLKI